jgi:CheY-like chemotaxis protein
MNRPSISQFDLPDYVEAGDAGSTLPQDLFGLGKPENGGRDDFSPTLPPDAAQAAPSKPAPGIPEGFAVRQAAPAVSASAAAAVVAGVSNAPNYPTGGPKVKHILMVDDDLTARLYMRAKLILRGNVQVLEASNGSDALEIVHHNEFDAVLLDVDMGIQNGYEVCKAIRNIVRKQGGLQPRIYMITSRTSMLDKMRAKLAGADEFLSKPPHPSELAKLLAAL